MNVLYSHIILFSKKSIFFLKIELQEKIFQNFQIRKKCILKNLRDLGIFLLHKQGVNLGQKHP